MDFTAVSKQLAISSAFSIFAMVAFVLFAVPGTQTAAGAKASASAPATIQVVSDLPIISG